VTDRPFRPSLQIYNQRFKVRNKILKCTNQTSCIFKVYFSRCKLNRDDFVGARVHFPLSREHRIGPEVWFVLLKVANSEFVLHAGLTRITDREFITSDSKHQGRLEVDLLNSARVPTPVNHS